MVNATTGLSAVPYRRFLGRSILGGVLWSTYTCVLAHQIGTALAGFPLASVVISGCVTTVALCVMYLAVRRRPRPATASSPTSTPLRKLS